MKSRPGFVLAVALFAIVIIAAIIASASFTATEETQATSASMRNDQAEAFAENIALGSLVAWPWDLCDQSAIGSVFTRESQSAPPLEGTLYITRLDSALYLVTGEGRMKTVAGVIAQRRISISAIARRDTLGAMHVSRTSGEYWAAIYQM